MYVLGGLAAACITLLRHAFARTFLANYLSQVLSQLGEYYCRYFINIINIVFPGVHGCKQFLQSFTAILDYSRIYLFIH